MNALKRSGWFLTTRLLEWSFHLTMLTMRNDSLWARRSTFTDGEIRKATNTANPHAFFDAFREGISNYPVTERSEVHPDGIRRDRLWFPSPFVSNEGANNTVRAALYRHDVRSPLALILICTFGTRFELFGHRMARTIAERGSDCCLIELPFSQGRTPVPGAWSSFLAADPVASAESFIQAVLDVKRFADVLEARYGYKHLGLVGISIGGNIAHVNTFLRPYEGTVLIISGVSPADIVWHAKGPYWRRLRRGMTQTHSFREIESLWTMSDTTRYTCSNLCPRFLMMNGLYDRLVTPEQTMRLNRQIGCEVIWYPGGHYNSFMFAKPAIENIVRFFQGGPVKQTGLRPRVTAAR